MPTEVYADSISVSGHGWHTDRNLRAGDSLARLRSLYPGATMHKDGWWLHQYRNNAIGSWVGDLLASVSRTNVTRLSVHWQAQGE